MNFIFRVAPASVRALPRPVHTHLMAWACVGIVFVSFPASAQTTQGDPLSTQITAPSSPLPSAFTDYKSYRDPELMPWKTANEVVREFGGMAGMGGMDDVKGTDSPTDNAGMTEPDNTSAQPSHDMGNMKEKSPPPAPKPAPSNGSASRGDMPGHDMSTMQPKTGPSATTKTPASKSKPAVPPPMTAPDHGGMAH